MARLPVTPLLAIHDLTLEYRGRATVHAVTGADLEVQRGEVVAVIGETGSGKSSVVRTVLGLLPRNGHLVGGSASLHVDGRSYDLLGLTARELRSIRGRLVGFVPQSTRAALNPVIDIAAHFRSTYRAHGVPVGRGSDWRDRASVLLAELGFQEPARVLGSYPHQLSGGMAQRVALALATALDPALVVADEPTSGLDATVKVQVLREFARQARERGRGVLMVTHDIGAVASTCDRVVVMYGGTVVEAGEASAVLGSPAHPYTRALLDSIPRRGQPLRSLPGNATPVLAPLERCAFAARCPVRDERCLERRPELRELGHDHSVASYCVDGGHAA